MAQAVDEAKRERELTKQSLSENLDRLEARVRHELDWKARLRRNGPRYAVIGGGVLVAVAGAVIARKTVLKPRRSPIDTLKAHLPVTSLAQVAEELQALREQLGSGAKPRKKDAAPLPQRILLRAVTAAGAAAGTMAARHVMERFAPGPLEEAAANAAEPDRSAAR